jgi:hypothetical protein
MLIWSQSYRKTVGRSIYVILVLSGPHHFLPIHHLAPHYIESVQLSKESGKIFPMYSYFGAAGPVGIAVRA